MPHPSRRAVLIGGAAALTTLPSAFAQAQAPQPWRAAAATSWQARQPWRLGCNFIPSSAVNQLEMWQAETFDEDCIGRELGWAAGSGMNAVRVFLHDIPWQRDAPAFAHRIDRFLTIASGAGLGVLFVLFDSCWDPFPQPGPQPAPRPGVHNSRWVQSPGAPALRDPSQHRRLKDYVDGLLGAFGKDDRVLAWDLWNEPDNLNPLSYGRSEPADKLDLVLDLLPRVFAWARGAEPIQPLTSAVWQGDWSSDDRLSPIERVQLDQSDVISFHNYGPGDEFTRGVAGLRRYGRPILCTEYMARPRGSTFEAIAPLAEHLGVAAFNWGFVAGKTQTWLAWDTWQHPDVGQSASVWFHDVFHRDGTAYRRDEIELLRSLAKR